LFRFQRRHRHRVPKVNLSDQLHTVGVLVQCNTGDRQVLRIAGAPVGEALSKRWLPCYDPQLSPADKQPKCAGVSGSGKPPSDAGSIIIVVATDAPLLPVQLTSCAQFYSATAALAPNRKIHDPTPRHRAALATVSPASAARDCRHPGQSPVAYSNRLSNVVVTGGTGALGTAVVGTLLAAGAVTAFYGGLNTLWASIHIAGGFAFAPIAQSDKSLLTGQLESNLISAYVCSRAAVGAFRRGPGPGRIVNVAARQASEPRLGASLTAYTVSKAGLVARRR
jgi:hypothetical protein